MLLASEPQMPPPTSLSRVPNLIVTPNLLCDQESDIMTPKTQWILTQGEKEGENSRGVKGKAREKGRGRAREQGTEKCKEFNLRREIERNRTPSPDNFYHPMVNSHSGWQKGVVGQEPYSPTLDSNQSWCGISLARPAPPPMWQDFAPVRNQSTLQNEYQAPVAKLEIASLVEPPPKPVPVQAGPKTNLPIALLVDQARVIHMHTGQKDIRASDQAHSISVGSVGHPRSCQQPCKYFSKPRGCKEGAQCTRCHLCKWNRYAAAFTSGKKPQKKDMCTPWVGAR